MFKKLFLAVALFLAVVIGVVLVRAWSWQPDEFEPAPLAEIEPLGGAVERLSNALTFATIAKSGEPFDNEPFVAFLDWLEASFPLTFSRLEVERVSELSLLLTWPGHDPALDPILLMAHYDVVPVEPGTEDEWTHPPFSGALAEGFVWGRGALDNKSGVTGLLEAVEALLAAGFEPQRTVTLAFGHDEEVSGQAGAMRIAARLAERGVRLHWVLDEGGYVITDGLGLDGPALAIGTAEKGYLSLRLQARAPGGHSSSPPERTAVGMLATAIERIQSDPFETRLQPPVSESTAIIGSRRGFVTRMLVTNQWLFGPLLRADLAGQPATRATVRTTIAPTMISGGAKDNVLPQRAEAVINFRVLQGDSVESVTERVRGHVDDLPIEIEPWGSFIEVEPSPVTPTDSGLYRTLAALGAATWPQAVSFPNLLAGGTDSRHYQALTDQVIRFMPLAVSYQQVEGVHGTDERLGVESYLEGIRFYASLIKLAAGETAPADR